ncbi:DNA-binding MarR family transcriptional regulator [Bradyrhizobium sp. LB7.2]
MPAVSDCINMLDSETKAVETPEDHAEELRLWLRLLTCTTLIEGEVRGRLRQRFDVTLPRFDLMAQLDKAPDGMTLSDVSKRMMVSNGNVTGLVERLVESGHLDRRTSETDRRVQVIRLTKLGRAEFRKNGRGTRDLDRRSVRRSDAEGCPRIDAAARQDQGIGAEISRSSPDLGPRADAPPIPFAAGKKHRMPKIRYCTKLF